MRREINQTIDHLSWVDQKTHNYLAVIQSPFRGLTGYVGVCSFHWLYGKRWAEVDRLIKLRKGLISFDDGLEWRDDYWFFPFCFEASKSSPFYGLDREKLFDAIFDEVRRLNVVFSNLEG